jgi:hypothetical protein
MNNVQENLKLNYNLNIIENKLTIPKTELKNVKLIITTIIEKTNLSVFDVYDLVIIK